MSWAKDQIEGKSDGPALLFKPTLRLDRLRASVILKIAAKPTHCDLACYWLSTENVQAGENRLDHVLRQFREESFAQDSGIDVRVGLS